MSFNLTCLANLKTWLNVTTDTDDNLMSGMITAFSDVIMSYLERPNFALTQYTEYRSGVGNQKIMLRNWPAVSVSSVQVSPASYGYGGNMFGTSGVLSPPLVIPAQQSWGQPGYFLEPWDGTAAGRPQNLVLSGYTYPRGNANIQIVYKAGYAISGEAQTIPSTPGPYTVTPNCPTGPFLADNGPTYANGTAFTLVTALTAAGQYTLAVSATTGIATYTFDAADQGVPILLNYSFVPASIERACIQWTGEQYSYRGRIGQKTKSLGGEETASYDTKDMPDFIAQILKPYAKWFPI
jgi:hypothetical protein